MNTYVIKYLASDRAKTPRFVEIEAESASRAVSRFLDQSRTTIVMDVFDIPVPREEWQA